MSVYFVWGSDDSKKILTPEGPTRRTVKHATWSLLPACARYLEDHHRTAIVAIVLLSRSERTARIRLCFVSPLNLWYRLEKFADVHFAVKIRIAGEGSVRQLWNCFDFIASY